MTNFIIVIHMFLLFLSHGMAYAEELRSPIDKPAALSFRWYYNPKGEPSWLDSGEGLKLVEEALKAWSPCGVRFEFAGVTNHLPGVRDGLNVIGWDGKLGPGKRAITKKMASRKMPVMEQDVAFSSSRDELRRYPRLLRKVMMHEIGHVLGLKHSPDCGEVMSLGADCRGVTPLMLPFEPTPNDMNICISLASERFSVPKKMGLESGQMNESK
jgi:hypothetical protein